MGDSWEKLNMEDVPEYIEKHGVDGIGDFFKAKLERWKDVEINIGVIGDAGVGKSSFINAIRGCKDEDSGAAKAGVTETTTEAAVYPHTTNEKIKFWDLPGIGTQNYPDLKTYSEKVGLEKYDTFLILCASRFTENDLLLAQKVKSIEKSFFFARTKIDQDIDNESRKKAFNEEATLNNIRKDCLDNLKDLVVDDEIVFLISNRKTAEWDFNRLTQAILDALPLRQKESFSLSLDMLTSRSKNLLKRKVEILRGRIWMVAGASAAARAFIAIDGLSIAVDCALLENEMNFYKSQLGLPEENSDEFWRLTLENQEKVRELCLTSAVHIAKRLAPYVATFPAEEFARYNPFVGSVISGGISFASTYYFLDQCLKIMEETAMTFLDETSRRVEDEYM